MGGVILPDNKYLGPINSGKRGNKLIKSEIMEGGVQKKLNVAIHPPVSFSSESQAFTLVELMFALGLGVLSVGLGLFYFCAHTDAFKKEELAQNLSALAEAAVQQLAVDIQGIDFTIGGSQALLGLSSSDWVGHSFVTRVPQDHPLFSDEVQAVRYVLLGEDAGRSAGLYREVAGQKSLLLPACKAMEVTLYVQDEAGIVLAVTEAKSYDRLAYAKIHLKMKRSCLQSSQDYDFETYVYYHYALLI